MIHLFVFLVVALAIISAAYDLWLWSIREPAPNQTPPDDLPGGLLTHR